MELILGSYLIGFFMSMVMGAALVDVPQKELTPVEVVEVNQLKQDIQDDDEDIGSLVRLGQIYFLHNQLKEADKVLTQAKVLEPEDSDVLAWWGTTQTKIAGASVPWCWGICKINALKDGVAAINQAIAINPQNPNAHIVRINTLTGLKGKFSDFNLVFEDENFFMQNAKSFPDGLMANAYVALASAYVWKFKEEGKREYHVKASDYLNQAKQKKNTGEDPEFQKSIKRISQQLNQEAA